MDWLVTLENGENFVVVNQPDEEEALAAAVQVRDDHFQTGPETAIRSVEPQE